MDHGDPKPACTGTPLTIVGLFPVQVDGRGVVEGVGMATKVRDAGNAVQFSRTFGIPRECLADRLSVGYSNGVPERSLRCAAGAARNRPRPVDPSFVEATLPDESPLIK